MKHIIIGGVAGGATAAARIRRADENAEIILLEKGEYISYANCGLPYYIGGTIKEREKLFVLTPEAFSEQFNIDVRINSEAIKINSDQKNITIKRKDGSEYVEFYDKLLLSPGASPIVPPIPGIKGSNIFTLRNVNDTDRIKEYIANNNVKKAIIVGAGFIGLEMAENLHALNIKVNIVELANQVMAPIDFTMAQFVHIHLQDKGVNLNLEDGVKEFSDKGVILNSGKNLEADIIILSIGVKPNVQLAKEADIKLGETGGILVNEYLQTSIPDIYAVGDAIEFPHPITRKPWLNYLANPANRQGRIVADNMVMGNSIKYEGAIGTAIAKVFDLTVATTGLPAKKLKQMGIDYLSSYTQSNSHAGYYPDARPIYLKLIFEPNSGKLFGAQAVGYEGVDKRIDQIALIIKNGGTVYDLTRIEHSYAPPFSSAKDPIAIAGYAACNILSGKMQIIHWRQLDSVDYNNYILLDVRTANEFSFGNITGSINIPLEELRNRLNELDRKKSIIIYCAVGLRGYLAQQILSANGFNNVKNLSGGYAFYKAGNHVIDTELTNYNNMETNKQQEIIPKNTIKIDACGLSCPGPIMKVKQAIDSISAGERIEITSTDAGFSRDANAWCHSTGNKLVNRAESAGKYTITIEKGLQESCPIKQESAACTGKTFIMFSDDLDKALATFVLANGALATGAKTTIFFTFWGLNVIKKETKPKVKKDIFAKMFSFMLPSSSKKLALSKMSMFGIGDKMMRYIMKSKQIESLENLRQQAIDSGAEFIACQMSMDVMGVNKEELLDNVTIGGVATYLDRANDANVNLFI